MNTKKEWKFLYSRSVTNQSLSNLKVNYEFNEEYQFFGYQNLNKLPNDNYNLYQSSYVNYNWSNNFKNEKNSHYRYCYDSVVAAAVYDVR
jgi:hypothetical protein